MFTDIRDRNNYVYHFFKIFYLFIIYFLSENKNDKRTKASMVDQIDHVFIGRFELTNISSIKVIISKQNTKLYVHKLINSMKAKTIAVVPAVRFV